MIYPSYIRNKKINSIEENRTRKDTMSNIEPQETKKRKYSRNQYSSNRIGVTTFHPLAPNIPETVFMMYQMTFAIITATLVMMTTGLTTAQTILTSMRSSSGGIKVCTSQSRHSKSQAVSLL
jgi:hypothetical protein